MQQPWGWNKRKVQIVGIYLASMSLRPINLGVPLVSSLQRSATPPPGHWTHNYSKNLMNHISTITTFLFSIRRRQHKDTAKKVDTHDTTCMSHICITLCQIHDFKIIPPPCSRRRVAISSSCQPSSPPSSTAPSLSWCEQVRMYLSLVLIKPD